MPLITSTPSNIVFSNASGSDTLQGAIDRAQANGLPLFIAPGVYTQAPVIVSAPITIYARKDSVVLKSPGAAAFSISVGSSSSSAVIRGVVLQGLNIDGENKPTGNGLAQFYNSERMVVEDCFFWRSASSGIYLQNSEGRITGNRCDNCVKGIVSVNGAAVAIEANYISNAKDNGIQCYHNPWATTQTFFDGVIIHGNRIYTTLNQSGGEGQNGNAIICSGLQYLRISDNLVWNANFSAIRIDYCRDVVISGNQIFATMEVAIFVENPADYPGGWRNVVVAANTIDNAGGGIVCANNNAGSRSATITGNTISNIKRNSFPLSTGYNHVTHGVGIWLAADCVVSGNTIENAESAGIAAIFSGTWNGSLPDRNSIAAIVSGNIVKYCNVGIGYSDNDFRTHCDISGNTIVGAATFQIVKMAATSLPAPAPAGNLYGPPAPVNGSPEMGSVTNSVTTRWTFSRNKIVARTV